jgi:hypothetical protein
MVTRKVAVVVPAEVRKDGMSVQVHSKSYGPTTLVMLFDSPEQLAEIRRLMNGEGR